jgi:antitoxin ParD1/3/4
MASRGTHTISLPPELDKFIEAKVSSGRYQSASEVIREGLHLLKERELSRQAALEEVRQKIAVGLDQAARGELFDGEEACREILEKL